MVFDEYERRFVVRARRAEEVVESDLQRAGFQFAVPIWLRPPAEAIVPLAQRRSAVAGRFQQPRQRHLSFVKIKGIVVLPFGMPKVGARQDRIARGIADRRHRVAIGEPRTLPGQAVHARRLDPGGTVAANVAVAEVIRKINTKFGLEPLGPAAPRTPKASRAGPTRQMSTLGRSWSILCDSSNCRTCWKIAGRSGSITVRSFTAAYPGGAEMANSGSDSTAIIAPFRTPDATNWRLGEFRGAGR